MQGRLCPSRWSCATSSCGRTLKGVGDLRVSRHHAHDRAITPTTAPSRPRPRRAVDHRASRHTNGPQVASPHPRLVRLGPSSDTFEMFTDGGERPFVTPNFPAVDAVGHVYVSDSNVFGERGGRGLPVRHRRPGWLLVRGAARLRERSRALPGRVPAVRRGEFPTRDLRHPHRSRRRGGEGPNPWSSCRAQSRTASRSDRTGRSTWGATSRARS